MDEKTTESPKLDQEFDMESVYANNSRFEASVWDLKILFGQLEQHSGLASIDWHTAVTIPWMQAKVLSYFLQANIIAHETTGRIKIHKNVAPPVPLPPSEDEEKAEPHTRTVYELLLKLHTELFGEP